MLLLLALACGVEGDEHLGRADCVAMTPTCDGVVVGRNHGECELCGRDDEEWYLCTDETGDRYETAHYDPSYADDRDEEAAYDSYECFCRGGLTDCGLTELPRR